MSVKSRQAGNVMDLENHIALEGIRSCLVLISTCSVSSPVVSVAQTSDVLNALKTAAPTRDPTFVPSPIHAELDSNYFNDEARIPMCLPEPTLAMKPPPLIPCNAIFPDLGPDHSDSHCPAHSTFYPGPRCICSVSPSNGSGPCH